MSLFDSASLVVTPNGYKEDKLYSIKPTDGSGDLVVTRATTATRVNSAGLVELVPYNFLERSQEFDNVTFWGVSQATISANATVAPDGTNTADKLIESNTNDIHEVYTNTPYTLTAGSNYTKSVFAKSAERTQVALNFVTGGFGQGARVIANLSNGTLGTITNYGGITESSATITNVGNGWYRISITIKPVTTANFYADFAPALSGNTTYLGNGTSGIYIWGAQLVAGTSSKEYFPTTDRLNVPRIDYTNGTCPNILVEPQRTNLALYSEQFNNAVWPLDGNGVGQSVTANYAISPDGTQNAERLILNKTGGTYSRILQLISSLGGSCVFSVYMKSNTTNNQNVGLRLDNTGINCVVTPNWKRFEVTSTITVLAELQIMLFDSIVGNDETADISIWGAQAEIGSYPTSYIPTTSASVTRNADVISKTGISSLIGQTEGTLFYDGIYGNEINEVYLFLQKEISTGVDDSIYIQQSAARIALNVYFGATQQVFIADGAFTVGQRIKIAAAYKNNDFVLYVNGVQIGADNSGSVPTCGALQFASYRGAPTTSNFIANKGCKISALWKTRLTNAELAELTTL